MLCSGTAPELYFTEYTLVHEDITERAMEGTTALSRFASLGLSSGLFAR